MSPENQSIVRADSESKVPLVVQRRTQPLGQESSAIAVYWGAQSNAQVQTSLQAAFPDKNWSVAP